MRRARAESRVHTEPDRPYGVSLARRTASASSAKGMTAATGPNTSSRATRSLFFASTSVGGNQKPGPLGAEARNKGVPSTNDATLSRWLEEISGPISVFESSGLPTRNRVVASTSSLTKRSYTDRSTKMRERAQQSWPALPNTAEGAAAAAFSRSASAKITLADFPPSSSVTRLTVLAAPSMTRLPTSVEPVKPILATSGWAIKRSPTTEPGPTTTLSTPSGRPAASASSAKRSAVSGVSSAGLRTTVLPHASAGPSFQLASMSGKFQGTMRPTTPSGSRNVMSTPPATGIVSP